MERESSEKNFIVVAVLMNLANAFDCISHDDLINVKLAAYGIEWEKLTLIYFYL